MAWRDKILKWIPKPFKYIQKRLQIEKEWTQFKTNLRPHKYKISFLFLIVTYPLYQPFLVKGYSIVSNEFTSYMHKSLQPTQPTFQLGQNLAKNLIDHILNDPNVKQQALTFLFKLLKEDKFLGQILQLLISALKNEAFLKELKVGVKQILIQQLNQPQIKDNVNIFLEGISNNEKVRNAFIKLVQDVFSSQESVSTLIALLQKGITNEQVQKSLAETINFGVREVLADEQTLNQLKIFIFFLLRKFENDDEIKGMLDLLFAKGLGLTKKKKDNELQKILKPKRADLV